MIGQKFLYLSRKDVTAIDLSMEVIIASVEEVFREKGKGRVEMPPKPGVHTRKDAFIHAMPAFIPSLEAAGIKWISGYPDNQKKGLPYITGLLILNDPDTGIPICLMDAIWVTAKRTGAATAVAAKQLARPDSSIVGIIACGVQGRSNLEALSTVFQLQKVKVYDVYPEIAERFSRDLSQALDLEIEVVDTPKECVNSDLVVTSGPILKEPQPVIEPGWLPEGSFASAVDFDSYWQSSAFLEVDKVATDDLEQMEYYREEGYFRETPRPYADLGEILAGKKPGRQSEEERTFCVNLGIALNDMATGIIIYREAKRRGLGIELPF